MADAKKPEKHYSELNTNSKGGKMLESIFIILLISAIIFLILTVIWESLALCGLDISLWLLCALGILKIDIVTSTGTTTIENMHPLSILFGGVAIVMTLYLIVNLVSPHLTQKIKDRRML